MENWKDFYVLAGTAAATLTGLLFVALTVNKETIGQEKNHRSVARQTLLCLTSVLVAALLGLLAEQGGRVLGWEIAAAALANLVPSLIIAVRILMMIRRDEGYEEVSAEELRAYVIKAVTYNGTIVAALVSGLMLTQNNSVGRFVLAASLFSFTGLALRNAWDLVMHVDDPAEDDEGSNSEEENKDEGKQPKAGNAPN